MSDSDTLGGTADVAVGARLYRALDNIQSRAADMKRKLTGSGVELPRDTGSVEVGMDQGDIATLKQDIGTVATDFETLRDRETGTSAPDNGNDCDLGDDDA